MENATRRSVRYLRRDNGGSAQENAARTSGSERGARSRVPDLRAIVDCLLAAHYSEDEILDYLTGPLGLSDGDAAAAMLDAREHAAR
jgi:hypothetical protein